MHLPREKKYYKDIIKAIVVVIEEHSEDLTHPRTLGRLQRARPMKGAEAIQMSTHRYSSDRDGHAEAEDTQHTNISNLKTSKDF